MPVLTPTNSFLEDIGVFRSNAQVYKKIVKALALLANNPLHPGLHIERIVNDQTAWSVRVDKKYRISLDPEKIHPSGNPDWNDGNILLRVLGHDDLYKHPR